MEQISKKTVCYYCYGCNRLEDEKFKGLMRCEGFLAGRENWEELRREELKKNEIQFHNK